MLKGCEILVCDECTMAHEGDLEALDRTLRGMRDCQHPIGSVPVLLLDEFMQTLLAVPKSIEANAGKSCMESSPLWLQFKIFSS